VGAGVTDAAGALDGSVLDEVDALLAAADARLAAGWPGDPGTRQPVHTLYVPADRAAPDLVAETGRAALAAVEAHGGDPATMAVVTGLPGALVEDVWPRVLAKLAREPVEDLRLDLEDGYGRRDDAEEDGHAAGAGALLRALGGRDGSPFACGVRMKSLERPTRRRGIRSLDLLLAAAGGLPDGFVVTLPKVTSVAQVRAMVLLCDRLEVAHRLGERTLRFEIQVETPQAVLGADGTATVAPMVHAAAGRCTGLHYGTYDYSASLGVAAAHQSMEHPVADHAKDVMAVAAAQTGVRVSDGSTNVLPVGDTEAVRSAWALHARLVRRSLERGVYQGWDLHAAQLPTRYLATYAFYRAGLPTAAQRLRAYAERADTGVLDEPATALALAGFLLRGVDCGALDMGEVVAATSLHRRDLAGYARRPLGGTDRLDALTAADLRARLLEVCSSRAWADAVVSARPFRTAEDLYAAADRALDGLSETDVDQALAGHPRIGERADSAASRREQSGVSGDATLAALAEGNRAYEERFGHVYLVCASGRSGEDLLAVLRSRLGNDPATERRVVREELGKINRLRLQRLVEEG
jgi:OHCU decarboxylase